METIDETPGKKIRKDPILTKTPAAPSRGAQAAKRTAIVMTVGIVLGIVPAYTFFWSDPAHLDTYKNFADALLSDEFDIARSLSTRDVEPLIADMENNKQYMIRNGERPEYTFLGTTYAVLDSRVGKDGSITLLLEQTIRFRPPGELSITGHPMNQKQRATLKEINGSWKVSAFQTEYPNLIRKLQMPFRATRNEVKLD